LLTFGRRSLGNDDGEERDIEEIMEEKEDQEEISTDTVMSWSW